MLCNLLSIVNLENCKKYVTTHPREGIFFVISCLKHAKKCSYNHLRLILMCLLLGFEMQLHTVKVLLSCKQYFNIKINSKDHTYAFRTVSFIAITQSIICMIIASTLYHLLRIFKSDFLYLKHHVEFSIDFI